MQPKVFWNSTMEVKFKPCGLCQTSDTTLGSPPPQHNKHQGHETSRAERNSSALRYCWAPAPDTEQHNTTRRPCPSCTEARNCKQPELVHRSGDRHPAMQSIPQPSPPSSCHGPAAITPFPALKTSPPPSLGHICSLHLVFAL